MLNISDANVTLYDPNRGTPWRFTDDPENPGVELLFPAEQPITLEPGDYLLLVRDVSLFQSRFTAPSFVQVVPWGAGGLSDSGETLQLCRPGDLDDEGVRNWIAVDRVRYSDGSHHKDFTAGIDLWPAQADGQGLALTKTTAGQPGDDPLNWRAITPSPGTAKPRPNR